VYDAFDGFQIVVYLCVETALVGWAAFSLRIKTNKITERQRKEETAQNRRGVFIYCAHSKIVC
jgi:hypothetical protein